MTIKICNHLPNKNGFAFSIFPLIIIESFKYVKYTKYDIIIAWLFWNIEINWKTTKIIHNK